MVYYPNFFLFHKSLCYCYTIIVFYFQHAFPELLSWQKYPKPCRLKLLLRWVLLKQIPATIKLCQATFLAHGGDRKVKILTS